MRAVEHAKMIGHREDQQLRRDRVTAIVMLIAMMLIFALIMWLASLGNGNVEQFEYWTVPF